MTVKNVEALMTALTQQPLFSHHRSRQLFFQLYSDVVMQFWSNSNLNHEVLAEDFCTDAAPIVGSVQDLLLKGVPAMRKSVLLQVRRAKESASTGLAHCEVKLHKDANPVLIFGELMRVTKSRKVELSEEMQEILVLHNVFRCMHDVPLLEWDTSSATTAQPWADNGVYEHSSSDFRNQGSEICGENLAWGYPTRTGLGSTQAWYDEIGDTDGGLGLAESIYSDSGKALGHYTQVVWKTSTRLGCGVGRATVNNLKGDYWVCQYCSVGNYRRQFCRQRFLAHQNRG